MKQTKLLMGMPITVEVVAENVKKDDFDKIYDYFKYVDDKFSTYKKNSEITKINDGLITSKDYSEDMKTIFKLSQATKDLTGGYFDIEHSGKIDPSGIVKGWSIWNAAQILLSEGFKNLYVEAGGDIQTYGKNSQNEDWSIGIQNPFDVKQIVKILTAPDLGVATSGTYLRGQHIYNPKNLSQKLEDIVSLTVIGTNIYEADRFATAAFAMGKNGINFIEKLEGFEGYQIDKVGQALFTTGFNKYVKNN